jgi:hypothetical protein
MGTAKWRREVTAGVEALGIEVLSIEASNSKHLKMRCRYQGREWNQTLSVSPSTSNALPMAIREARRRRDGLST